MRPHFGDRVPCHRRRVAGRGGEARYYFTDLLGDAGRLGHRHPFNQSRRGTIPGFSVTTPVWSRWFGCDRQCSGGPLLLAWRTRLRSDRLGKRGGRRLFGLLLSPMDSPLGVAGAADDLAD